MDRSYCKDIDTRPHSLSLSLSLSLTLSLFLIVNMYERELVKGMVLIIQYAIVLSMFYFISTLCRLSVVFLILSIY